MTGKEERVAYRHDETGELVDAGRLSESITTRLGMLHLRSDPVIDELYSAWLDRNFTASGLNKAERHRLPRRFAKDVLEDDEALGRLGYTAVKVQEGRIITTPGLLACGVEEDGRHVSVSIGYVPATKGYVLDVTREDMGTFRVLLDGRALRDMTEEIKLLRRTIREEEKR